MAQDVVQDSSESKESSYIFLPAVYFTPETKWAGGIVFQYYFYPEGKDSLSRPSTFNPFLIYTQKRQVITQLEYDLYFQKQKYHLYGQTGYQKFPNSFFGIGNNSPDEDETYTPSKFEIIVTFLKKISPGINVGLKFEFENSKLSGLEVDGLLNNTNIPGKKAGTISGFGVAAEYDTRDNIYYASYGRYYQISALSFGAMIGSDYTYNRYNLDFREYFSIYKDHVIALQSYMNFIDGQAPFYKYSQLGGSKIMRGFFEGRFMDKHAIVFQSEYRKHIWYKIYFAAFGGLGQVAPQLSNFKLNAFKYTAGLGFRFMIDDAEKVNIRFDYGIGQNGASGFYMHITEAF